MQNEITQKHMHEMDRLKSYFPFRIVFAIVDKDGSVDIQCRKTMRVANDAARAGKKVMIFSYQ